MITNYNKNNPIFFPKSIVYTLLLLGLMAIVYALIFQKWTILSIIICSPVAVIACLYALRSPMFSYLLIAFASCYYSALYRYSGIEGLSGIFEILMIICLFSIVINVINSQNFPWKLGVNILTLTYPLWLILCVLQLLNPHSTNQDFTTSSIRNTFIILPMTYLISGILLNSQKRLRLSLVLLGVFILTAAFKLYWQKARGWDATEIAWLMEGSWTTHLLSSGVRYFSFFSDAGNFGAIMGMFTIIFAIITFTISSKYYKLFFFIITSLSGIGLLMSGTRGAMVVPFGGILLYLLLSKNAKVISISMFIGALIFCFFYFTDIGDDNVFIRRMRTAFRPTEDASFNVRLENQKRFAHYLKDKPFGMGLGGKVVDKEQLMKLNEDFIPTDSFYVGIWVETGVVGLCLYLAILITILLRCCYIIMFHLHNKELRNILSALLCGVFGLWISGYVNRAMGFQPGSFLIAVFLSFVLNGRYIEKQLKGNIF